MIDPSIFSDAKASIEASNYSYDARLMAGMLKDSRPVSLTAWRIESPDESFISELAELLGGQITPDGALDTGLTSISAELLSLKTSLAQWGRRNLIRQCDGVTQTDGTPCVCPSSLRDRKEAARNELGCKPNIEAIISPVGSDIRLKLSSGSWDFLQEIAGSGDTLKPGTTVTVDLVHVSYTTKQGRAVDYRHPRLSALPVARTRRAVALDEPAEVEPAEVEVEVEVAPEPTPPAAKRQRHARTAKPSEVVADPQPDDDTDDVFEVQPRRRGGRAL